MLFFCKSGAYKFFSRKSFFISLSCPHYLRFALLKEPSGRCTLWSTCLLASSTLQVQYHEETKRRKLKIVNGKDPTFFFEYGRIDIKLSNRISKAARKRAIWLILFEIRRKISSESKTFAICNKLCQLINSAAVAPWTACLPLILTEIGGFFRARKEPQVHLPSGWEVNPWPRV